MNMLTHRQSNMYSFTGVHSYSDSIVSLITCIHVGTAHTLIFNLHLKILFHETPLVINLIPMPSFTKSCTCTF